MFTITGVNITISFKFVSVSESYLFLNVHVSKCLRGVCVSNGQGNTSGRYIDNQEANFKKENYKASINKIVAVSICKYKFPVTDFKGILIAHHCTMINIYFGILNYLEFWPKRPDHG